MALSQNVYRRGGVYWWRRRFTEDGTARTLALSLRVRDPAKARILGAQLNAEAARIAHRVEAGMSSIDEERDKLNDAIGDGFMLTDEGWADVTRGAGTEHDDDDPGRSHRSNIREPETVAVFSRDQERKMLLAMSRDRNAYYDNLSRYNRSQIYGDEARVGAKLSDLIADEKAIACVYRLIAEHGVHATVDERVRQDLLASGFMEKTIGFIEREVHYHARREADMEWSLGVARAYFENALRDVDAEPSRGNVRRIRRGFLYLTAEILTKSEQRYHEAGQPIPDVLAEPNGGMIPTQNEPSQDSFVLSSPDVATASAAVKVTSGHQNGSVHPTAKAILASRLAQAASEKRVELAYRSDDLGDRIPLFLASVKNLAEAKIRDKVWDEKGARQHESIARLFAKLTETDDPRRMGQSDVNEYRWLLDIIPKHYGKSSRDEALPLLDIVVRGDDLDDEEVGLASGTINRHMTQFGTILDFFKSNGIAIGTIDSKMRLTDDFAARPSFSLQDLDDLFRADIWLGPGHSDIHSRPGDGITHDALYWVPLLGTYLMLRLSEACGLLVTDVDRTYECIIVRNNSERRLKTKESARRLPIPPEMIRLGFLDYVAAIAAAGHTLLFPELRMRGEATSLQNLFYKDFSTALWKALPNAQLERKSFHSFRKTGNTAMTEAKVDPVVRRQILGHKGKDVNEINYTDRLSLQRYSSALLHIPIVTAHINAQPLRLQSGLVASKKRY